MASKIAEAKKVISDLLEKEHSRVNTEVINDYIGRDPKRVQALMDIICTDTKKLHQRGCYVLWMMRFHKSDLVMPHLERLLGLLPDPPHEAFTRALTSILQGIEIPDKLLGIVADHCFSYLEDPKATIASKANSMTVCLNICKREPDLINDLELLINEYYEHGSAGYKSRANRVLKELQEIRKNTEA